MSDELERLRLENTALRGLLESAYEQIDSEWGDGNTPDPEYRIEAELAEAVCRLKGHGPTELREQRYLYNGLNMYRADLYCTLCDGFLSNEQFTGD